MGSTGRGQCFQVNFPIVIAKKSWLLQGDGHYRGAVAICTFNLLSCMTDRNVHVIYHDKENINRKQATRIKNYQLRDTFVLMENNAWLHV